MTLFANHHAHSHFSDGALSPEDYVKRAIFQNLKVYGFSDHAPIPSQWVGIMEMDQLRAYLREVDRLKEVYAKNIQLYKGLEVDYIPGVIDLNAAYIREAGLDYTIGAVHYVDQLPNGRPWGFQSSHEKFQTGLDQIFGGDVRACIRRYYALIREMLGVSPPDIVAHLDRVKRLNRGDRYFCEQDSWYQEEVRLTLEAIAEAGVILEINTKGYYNEVTEDTYPGKWVLELAWELKIPVHLASDAHKPDHITSGFAFASNQLKQIGYKTQRVLLDGTWQDVPLKRSILSQLF
jgi:histidinol-phosphatase (PHP family)